jgi:hypothetical protein
MCNDNKENRKGETKPRDFVFFLGGMRDSETRKNPTKRRGKTKIHTHKLGLGGLETTKQLCKLKFSFFLFFFIPPDYGRRLTNIRVNDETMNRSEKQNGGKTTLRNGKKLFSAVRTLHRNAWEPSGDGIGFDCLFFFCLLLVFF